MLTCPVCSTPNGDSLRYVDHAKCTQCGHLFRARPPAQGSELPEGSQFLRNPIVYRLLEWYDRTRLAGCSALGARPVRVMDIGCGPRFTLRNLRRMGIDSIGLEPNPAWDDLVPPSEAAVLRLKLQDLSPGVAAGVGCALLFHVIEHIAEPTEAIRCLEETFDAGTTFVVRTPDAEALALRIWGRSWFPLCPDEHPGLFTKHSLGLAILQRERLSIRKVESPFFVGDSAASVHRLLGEVTGSRSASALLVAALAPAILGVELVVAAASTVTGRAHELQVTFSKEAGPATFVTFVIPAYNEAKRIGRLLSSLAASIAKAGVPVSQFEMVVVDNGSTDATAEIAHAWGARVVGVAERHIARARNAGGAVGRGTYLVFIDADYVVPSSFCASLIRNLITRFPDTAGVVVEPNADGGEFSRRLGRVLLAGLRRATASSFGVFIMRREIFNELGGFDERLYAFEDVAWLVRFKILGYVGRCKRYEVLSGIVVEASTRAARRKGAAKAYVSHLLFPWRWFKKTSCGYWYAERASD